MAMKRVVDGRIGRYYKALVEMVGDGDEDDGSGGNLVVVEEEELEDRVYKVERIVEEEKEGITDDCMQQ